VSGSEKQVKVKIPADFRVSDQFLCSLENDAPGASRVARGKRFQSSQRATGSLPPCESQPTDSMVRSCQPASAENRPPSGHVGRHVRFRRRVSGLVRRSFRLVRSRLACRWSGQCRLRFIHRHSGHTAEHRALPCHEAARGPSVRTDCRGTVIVRCLAHGATDAGGDQCHPHQAAEFPVHGFAFAERAACSGLASKWLVTASTYNAIPASLQDQIGFAAPPT
jgi:hypothetical protein